MSGLGLGDVNPKQSGAGSGKARLIALGLAAALTHAAPAYAQLDYSPGRPFSPAPLSPEESRQAAADLDRLKTLSCSLLEPSRIPAARAANPFAVRDDLWSSEMLYALIARARECGAGQSRSDAAFLRTVINQAGSDWVSRAETLRTAISESAARKDWLLGRLAAIAKEKPAEQVSQLRALRGSVSWAILRPDDRKVAEAAFESAQVRAQAAVGEENQQRLSREQAREAEQREAERRTDEQRTARLAKASPAVQAFIARNNGIQKQPTGDVRAWMRGLYAIETSLRICSRETGRYGRELTETTRRRQVFEAFLVELHQVDPAELKRERDAYGVETGTGRAADMLSADRITVLGACNGALAWSSSFFDFGG